MIESNDLSETPEMQPVYASLSQKLNAQLEGADDGEEEQDAEAIAKEALERKKTQQEAIMKHLAQLEEEKKSKAAEESKTAETQKKPERAQQ